MNERLLPRINLSEGWVLRVALLIGQSVSLGFTLSLLAIITSALLLADFGAQALPYGYILSAVAGPLIFYGLTALQRRWPLPRVAKSFVAVLAVVYLLCWLGLAYGNQRWISFALMVSYHVAIQAGFVFLGGQAGRLLDVRQIKRLFPLVVSGFVIGFLLGAFATPPLIGLLGSAEQALVGLSVFTLAWLFFLILTDRRYHTILNTTETGSSRQRPSGSMRQLLGKRYVLLLFVYLMLAAMIGQFSDFLVMVQAEINYPRTEDLAQFFSVFNIALNVTDLLFTTLIAGLLLSRFGLSVGLVSNPLVMLLFFVAMAVVGPTLGLSSRLFFVLAVLSRLVNITITDGLTRSSTNAAYQALPAKERAMVQTSVEGIGSPIALGFVGVLLLILNSLPGDSQIYIVFLTAVLSIAWLGISLAVYRSYQGSLVGILRRQVLGDGELLLQDPATQAVLDQLLHSSRPFEAFLALDVLERASHPSLDERLVELLEHPVEAVRVEALRRIEQRRPTAALPQVEAAVQGENPVAVQAAALRALAALTEGDANEHLVQRLEDDRREIRQAAVSGLLRYGGIPGVLAAGRPLETLQASSEPTERLFLAQVIGEVGARSLYRLLEPLLQDEDPEIRRAALLSAGKVAHPALLEPVAAGLNDPALRSAAVSALVDFGPGIRPVVQQALGSGSAEATGLAVRLVRICGQIGGKELEALLKEHLHHPVDAVRNQVLAVLHRCGHRAGPEDLPEIQRGLQLEAERAKRLLAVRRDLGEGEGFAPLLRALDGELASLRQRIFMLLAFQFDAPTLLRAGEYLASEHEGNRALAMEVLEVTLPANLKSLVMPVVDPQMALAQRLQHLEKGSPLPQKDREAHLLDLIANPQGIGQASWVRACAIYAAGSLALAACREAIERTLGLPDPTVRETAAWALERMRAASSG